MADDILSKIDSPEDVRQLSPEEKRRLAEEVRGLIIDVVSKNGGHLAPSLGAVDLAIALHSVFESPKDKIVWDVGHQAYAHKILTGRREFFKTLRQDDGCSGFLSRSESEHDAFGAGHAGTAISAALGMAAARDMRKGTEKIVAVVGDGSLNCGASLEGLNNAAGVTDDLIIVLNDNKMSISPNVGGMARYLNRLISARPYNRFKSAVRDFVRSIPGVGDDLTRKISRLEEAVKSVFVPGVIFEELGMRYIGPVDGHDIEEMSRVFDAAREFDQRPVLIHVVTEKGRGYTLAEKAPEKFHGLSKFDPDTGEPAAKKNGTTFSEVFGNRRGARGSFRRRNGRGRRASGRRGLRVVHAARARLRDARRLPAKPSGGVLSGPRRNCRRRPDASRDTRLGVSQKPSEYLDHRSEGRRGA